MNYLRIIGLIVFVISLFMALRITFGYSVLYYANELSGYLLVCGLAAVLAFPKWKAKWQVGFIFLVSAGVVAMLPTYPVPPLIPAQAQHSLLPGQVVVPEQRKAIVIPKQPAGTSPSKPTFTESYTTSRQREPRALPDLP